MLNTEAEKVREALLEKGLETPMTPSEMNPNQKYNRIKGLLTEVVSTLGLDLTESVLPPMCPQAISASGRAKLAICLVNTND